MNKILFAAVAGSAIMLAGCGPKAEEAPAADAAADAAATATDAAAVATDAAATATDAAATATDAAADAAPDAGATDAGTSGGSVRP